MHERSTESLSPWVFPNDAGDGPVGVKSLGKQLSDRQREAEAAAARAHQSATASGLLLPGGRWTAHDSAANCGDIHGRSGVSGDVIDECLNHMIESRVRRTYIRDRRIVQQRQAFDALGKFLDGLVRTSSPAMSRSTGPLSAGARRVTQLRDATFSSSFN